MAGILRQSFTTVASKALQNCMKITTVGVQNVKVSSDLATRGLTLKSASRAMHSIAASSSATTKLSYRTQICHCREYHTKGDENLAEFLTREIDHEKDNAPAPSPKLTGWTTTTDGSLVKLHKTFKDESITVEFDVTTGVEGDMDDQMFENEAPDDSQVMVSRPPFNIEIKKESGKALKLACEFTPPEPQFDEQSQAEQKDDNIEDQFSIIEVSLIEPGQTENYFTLSGGIMDEVMYDLLMEMLDERGIDDNFITGMVKYSTTHEQGLYVKFLQSMKDFVAGK